MRYSENRILTTPTGVSKGFMSSDMLVLTDLDGNVIEGHCRPSSELKMHLRIYRENSEVQAVVHAHPPVATSFAACRDPLDKALIQESVVQLGIVPSLLMPLPARKQSETVWPPSAETTMASALPPRCGYLGIRFCRLITEWKALSIWPP
jgi:L-fuculose-phosphate aldolase